LFEVSMQTPKHCVWPVGHAPQTPPVHDSPNWQLLPQLPQLLGSLPVSVQVPLQSTVGGGQGLVWQAPVTQA
jgi:hypothetical protein